MRTRVLLIVLCVALVSLHAYYYYPFLSDDALISARYAQRLLDGKGLTWTDGQPVEGYSNLLWLLMTGLLGAAGLDLVVALRVMGLVCVWLVPPALALGYTRRNSAPVMAAAAGCLAFVAAAPAAIWSIGGLEQPLVAALLAWVTALLLGADVCVRVPRGRLWPAGFLLGLLCLTRPDGPLFSAAFVLWLLLAGRFKKVALLNATVLLLPAAALVLGQLAFRLWYYGEWVPNTAYVKISPSYLHLKAGFLYVGGGIAALRPLSELALVAMILLLFDKTRRDRALLLLLTTVSWLGYVVFIGGDIFGGWRHMVPFLVPMVFALVLLVEWMAESRRTQLVYHAFLVLCFALFGYHQFTNAGNVRAKNDLWVWNCKTVGLMFKAGFGPERPLLAVTAAGGLPYWSELPCLDLLGLNDYHIARAPRPDFGANWIGHETGDADYVLRRQPDLLIFGTAGGGPPNFAYEELLERPEFTGNYDVCYFADVPTSFNSRVYVRRGSEKIGLRRTDAEVFVPPYLLNSWYNAFTLLDTDGRFFVPLNPNEFVGIKSLHLTAGTWEIAAPSEGVSVRVFFDRELVNRESTEGPVVFDADEPGDHDLVIDSSSGKPVRLYGLLLRKR